MTLQEPCLKQKSSEWNWHRGAGTGWAEERDYEKIKKNPDLFCIQKKEGKNRCQYSTASILKCLGEKRAKRY